MNKRIKLMNKISTKGTSVFNGTYEVGENVENPDGILVRSASLHDVELPENLKAIARAGAGVNNIPIEKCSEKGIVVFNTPGANANAVKELAILALLLSSRRVVAGIEWVKNVCKGQDVPKTVESGKSMFVGPELRGKVLGVIGLGAIGRQVANLATCLGMKVCGYDPYLSDESLLGGSIELVGNLDDIYRNSDYISLHVPSTPSTKKMINSESVELMKDEVRIINLSRADLVDNESIINSSKVVSYVTDFPTEDLIGINKVIAIPHLGASTPESEDNCAIMAAQEISEFLETGNIYNSVNYPTVMLSDIFVGVRIGVFHKNIPSMISEISKILADESINIEHISNSSKGDNAYTLIEISYPEGADLNADLISKIEEIPSVVRVRVINPSAEE